jgi:lipopolysaccharide transport system ATP-binding protein
VVEVEAVLRVSPGGPDRGGGSPPERACRRAGVSASNMSKSDIAISVKGLSKAYTISHNAPRRATFGETVMKRLRSPFARPETETFWALKDVDFEVKKGEVVGIIGRNGAGKSTLLKILSRITEPTSGRIELFGRVGSLLEVGTGFHPELTGRENIYLNGAVLGMRRQEISNRFDEIVEFAEVEQFLDTPVKRYSSGMYVRLAFAVAAHLDPEILIVDEVLAVGDPQFQKKCIGKLSSVASDQGRTVLVVSHNLGTLSSLCPNAIWLKGGRLNCVGASKEIVRDYLCEDTETSGCRVWKHADTPPSDVRLSKLAVIDDIGIFRSTIDSQQSFAIECSYEVLKELQDLRVAIRLLTADGIHVLTSSNQDAQNLTRPIRKGHYVSRCIIPGNLLNSGSYFVTISADVPFVRGLFTLEQAIRFDVENTGGVTGKYPERWPGVVCPKLSWSVNLESKTQPESGRFE